MEFQLLRLRLLRPPPSQFDCDRTVTCQLGLTVQDDYGLDFIAVPSVAREHTRHPAAQLTPSQ